MGGLWRSIRARRAHIGRLRRRLPPVGRKATAIVEEHGAIVDALERGDAAVISGFIAAVR